MDESHVEQAVDIHIRTFKGFFLTFLGPAFIRRYYIGFCRDPRAIRLVDQGDSGEVTGFVTGAMNPSGFFNGLIKKDWMRFCLAAAPSVLRNPGIIPRVARALRQPSMVPAGEDEAMMLSIGVLPGHKRKGIGLRLVLGFLDEAVRRGARKVYLVTDRDDNEPVNMFYRKAGFRLTREYRTREGRWMNEYTADVGGDVHARA